MARQEFKVWRRLLVTALCMSVLIAAVIKIIQAIPSGSGTSASSTHITTSRQLDLPPNIQDLPTQPPVGVNGQVATCDQVFPSAAVAKVE